MKHQIISHSHPSIDALAKVTGDLKFISDIRIPGMLWGQVVRSPYPHALIKEINTSEALKVPGVKAILTAADFPHIPVGPFLPDWEVLAREKVTFVGQEVAAVAAISPEAAQEAARLVEVVYEELPAVFEPEEALKPDAPIIRPNKKDNIATTFTVERGDVDKAFRESDFVREETFELSSAFHAYMEPNGSIASYDPLTDKYTLWLATQVPYKAWIMYSKALGVEPSQVHLIQPPIGGGFGGKFESNYHLVAAYLSKKVGQPVRLLNSLAEEFVTAPLRVPMKLHVKLGIKKDGTITGKDVTIIADNGSRTNYAPASVSTACYRVDSLYRIQNVRSKGTLVYTNNPSKGAMRGFGNPQMIIAMEAMLDALAEDAGIDPLEIRHKNAFHNGEISVHGWEIGSCGLSECIDKAAARANWKEKRNSPKKGRKRRGIGIGCCNHVSGYRPILRDFDGSSAIIKISDAGQVTVYTGEVDMGQGYNTVAAQCAAEELGIDLKHIKIAPVDSEISVLGIGCLASRGTMMGGNAVKKAAADAAQKIIQEAAPLYGYDKDLLTLRGGYLVKKGNEEKVALFNEVVAKLVKARAGQPIVCTAYYRPDTVLPDPVTNYGNPSPAYSFAAHVAEVEVDMDTGVVNVVNYVAANDVGKVINPLLANGQLEGGALQGIGWALTENIAVKNGKIMNPNFLDYKIPTFADMVNVEPILVEESDSNGPYGAKSLGEPAFDPVAAAVCNAIYNATGVRITKLPARPESMLAEIQAIEQRERR